jgi:CheY-like chemotaxis protein
MPIFDVTAISFAGISSDGGPSNRVAALVLQIQMIMTRSILLIDDDPEIRVMLRDFLEEQGFVVHTAREGQHALQVLERVTPPDLILLDYKMPVMDGRQFLAMQRRIPKLQNVPIVILSAATREWSGAHLEVEEVLTKPIDLEALLNTVNRICAEL